MLLTSQQDCQFASGLVQPAFHSPFRNFLNGRDLPDIQIRIADAYQGLPEAQRAIANALMADPLLGALWGIEATAERAGVSMGSVMRFAKRLGYRSYSDFRDALRDACNARSGGSESELADLEPPTDLFGTLAEVVQRDSQQLHRMIQMVDHAKLQHAAEILLQTRHRVILGRGVSQDRKSVV